jgi:hypothetical protein
VSGAARHSVDEIACRDKRLIPKIKGKIDVG